MYKCSECGSDSIEQKFSVYAPMNLEDLEPTTPWIDEGIYYCPSCDFDCYPIFDGKDD